MSEARADFRAQTRRAVERVVGQLGLKGEFAPGRRRSDIVLVAIRGEKAKVLALPLELLDEVPEIDVELLSLESSPHGLAALSLVVTEALGRQPLMPDERRAKLKRRLHDVAAEEGD
jgi:hypothetical protein